MNCKEKLLEVRDIHKVYTKEGVPTKALNGITFDVLDGEFLGIMGASGSGKTTLLNCIATVIKPTSGQVLLSGANVSSFDSEKLAEYRGNKIGYLFQDFALLDNLTGRENILLPLSIHNVDISAAEKKLNDIAGLFGITDVLSKFPVQMSGGQKQRVAAARSLISDPDIILADEPTGALDTKAVSYTHSPSPRYKGSAVAYGKTVRDQSRSRTHNFDGNTRPERCKFLFQNPIHTGRCDFP